MLRDRNLIPLSHQHHNGLALCVLIDRALASDSSAGNIAALARRCVERYELELANHFEIEEEILFPACEDPLVVELTAEHRQLEALVEGLRQAPSAELLGAFTALLRSHIRKEENGLFESAQKRIPPPRLEEIGRRIEQKVVRICL